MAESLDPDAMIMRFQKRAKAVRERPLPPVAGSERMRFIEQAQADFQDFAMVGDAVAKLEDGILTLRIDLRSPEEAALRSPEEAALRSPEEAALRSPEESASGSSEQGETGDGSGGS